MPEPITRRQFISKAGQAGIAFGVGVAFPGTLEQVLAGNITRYPDLAVVTGPAEAAVEMAVEMLGGIKRFVKPGNRVVLKPNLGFPNHPEEAATTSPEVVRETAQLCQQAGAREVLILDYPVTHHEMCLELSGIQQACRDIPQTHAATLHDQKFFREIDVPKGKVLRKVEVAKKVLEADVLINIPIAKSHGSAGVTFSMKNLMGVIWNRRVFHWKLDLDQAIADLSTVVRPHLIILDAQRVMTDGGPRGPGAIEKPGKIIAGVNPVTVDAYGVGVAKWYGKEFTPRQVKHILEAHELGLGEIDLEKVSIIQKNTG